MSIFSSINIGIGKVVNTVDTIADLRNYKPRSIRDGDTVIVSAGENLGDAAGGAFVWVEGSTVVDDGADTIKPVFAVGSGRWVKAFGKGGEGPVGPKGDQGAASTVPGPRGPQGDGIATVMAPGGASLVGYRQSPTSIGRALSDRLGEAVSVMDFGAKGDGVTDDTAAIQAAINYVENTVKFETYATASPAAGPQNLFFPAGFYIISDRILISRSISIYGDGHAETSGGSRIQQQTPARDHFTIAPIAQGASVSFTDLTLRANGGGGTGGSCINFTKPVAGGAANSCRIDRCFFFTPQTFAIRVQAGDDYVISRSTFDISATSCISLGSTAASGGSDLNTVTNLRIVDCDFFDIALKTITLWNCHNIVIANNTVWHSNNGSDLFIDAYETAPVTMKNIVVANNTFKGVRAIARVLNANGFIVTGNSGENMGGGAGASKSMIETFTANNGKNEGVVIEANYFSGSFGTKSFYDDSAGAVYGASISGNVFTNTGGSGAPLKALNTIGAISGNSFVGFQVNSIGQRWTTSGNSVTPGVVATNAASVVNFSVIGARQGDAVHIGAAGLGPFVPDGFTVFGYVSAPDTVSIRYYNQSAANPTGVPGHDLSVYVTR